MFFVLELKHETIIFMLHL